MVLDKEELVKDYTAEELTMILLLVSKDKIKDGLYMYDGKLFNYIGNDCETWLLSEEQTRKFAQDFISHYNESITASDNLKNLCFNYNTEYVESNGLNKKECFDPNKNNFTLELNGSIVLDKASALKVNYMLYCNEEREDICDYIAGANIKHYVCVPNGLITLNSCHGKIPFEFYSNSNIVFDIDIFRDELNKNDFEIYSQVLSTRMSKKYNLDLFSFDKIKYDSICYSSPLLICDEKRKVNDIFNGLDINTQGKIVRSNNLTLVKKKNNCNLSIV